MLALPLPLGPLDHYTLIVPDAKAAARFHCEVLGFRHLRTIRVNAGSAPDGEFDMVNEVLEIGGMPGRTCVITEGLTETSIFRRYLNRYGAGIHHVAYAVDRLEDAVATLQEADVQLTSSQIVVDAISGLRQIFIDRRYTGYFVELIERTPVATEGFFAAPNMADLARSITSHLDAVDVPEPARELDAPEIAIMVAADTLRRFLLDPANIGRWTSHRTVRRLDGAWREVRVMGDVLFETVPSGDHVVFRWSHGAEEVTVTFEVQATTATSSAVRIVIPTLDEAKRRIIYPLLEAELRLLKGILEESPGPTDATDRQLVAEHHLRVYQRSGL